MWSARGCKRDIAGRGQLSRQAKAALRRSLAGGASLAAHVVIAVLVVASWRAVTPPAAQPPIEVTLAPLPVVPPPPPPPPDVAPDSPSPEPDAAPKRAPTHAAPAAAATHPAPAPFHARPIAVAAAAPVAAAAAASPGDGLSDADVAGASRVGDGRPHGACDMASRLQAALRRDHTVLAQAAAAVRQADGRALRIWDGDWVQNGVEDGKGLSAVREAVVVEVAFAPAACRAETVRGLVLLTLGDGPGAARIAVGSGQWRWSDLLASGRP